MGTRLEQLLDALETAAGPPPLAAADGWRLVLRENIAYQVDDATRDHCLAALEQHVGLDPQDILMASTDRLVSVVAGMRPLERVARLRKCAELLLAGAPWHAYPGIGKPGVERIELLAGERAVFGLDSSAARALYRLGYGELGRSADTTYRSVQAQAREELPGDLAPLRRAHLLLRRHGQTVCRRTPVCIGCPVLVGCPAGQGERTLADPFAGSDGDD